MAAKNTKKKPRTPEQVRRGARVTIAVAAVLAIGCLVLIAACSIFAVRDHHNAQAYAAAPTCPAGVRGSGHCIAVLAETVVSMNDTGRSNDIVDLTGSLSVTFSRSAPSWAVGLERGESVRVQVWENQAQALVGPSGALVYDTDAAPKAMWASIGMLCLRAGVLFLAVATAVSSVVNAAIGKISLVVRAQPYRRELAFGECLVVSAVMLAMGVFYTADSPHLAPLVAGPVLVVGTVLNRIIVSRRRTRFAWA